MKEKRHGAARKLVKTLLDQGASEPYRGLLEEYVEENPDDGITGLISANWDLLLADTHRGSDVARALVQFALELPDDDPFRAEFLCEISDINLGTVYYCDTNSLFLKRSDYSFLGGHDTSVTALLSMGVGKLVSGDDGGRILAWESVYPPVHREIGDHSCSIVKLAGVDENRFLSVSSDGKMRVWEYSSGGMLNDFAVDEEIINTEIFGENIILVNVQRESETELYLGIHEITKQKKVALKGYDLSRDRWIWEREFDVDGISWVMPLPDGRAFLARTESTGFPSCLNCKHASVIDPETGIVDEFFQELSSGCETILYSILEMPVFLKRHSHGYKLIRHDGKGIQLNDHVQGLLAEDFVPILFPGLNILFMGERKQVFLEYPDFSEDNSRVFDFSDEGFIHRGRFFSGCRRSSSNPEALWFKLIDLTSGEEVFRSMLPPGDASLRTHMPDDETLIVATPRGHLIAGNLVTNERLVVRNLGIDSDQAVAAAQRYDENRIVIKNTAETLILIDKNNTPEPFSEPNSVEKVLGARGNLLFVEAVEGKVAAFDTDSCRKISEFGSFRDGVHGILHFEGDQFGAWSLGEGFKSWNFRTGEEIISYKMPGYKLTCVLILGDDSLLFCGSKLTDGFLWDEARIVLFEPKTGEETELLRIKSNRDPFNGNILFVKHNAIAGQCLELSNGKLLIPPHHGIHYRDRTVFDIIILDRSDPGKLMRIPLEGYTPALVEELPGGILMICTSSSTSTKEKRESLVFFRSMETGELLFTSPELEGYVTDAVYLSGGVTGLLHSDDLVSLFQISGGIRYLGDKGIEELLEEEEGFIEKNRKANEIGRTGRFLQMPGHSCSLDYRWAELWGTMNGNSITDAQSGLIAAGNPSQFTLAMVRGAVRYSYLFDNSIVVVDSNGKIGFLRKWQGGS